MRINIKVYLLTFGTEPFSGCWVGPRRKRWCGAGDVAAADVVAVTAVRLTIDNVKAVWSWKKACPKMRRSRPRPWYLSQFSSVCEWFIGGNGLLAIPSASSELFISFFAQPFSDELLTDVVEKHEHSEGGRGCLRSISCQQMAIDYTGLYG